MSIAWPRWVSLVWRWFSSGSGVHFGGDRSGRASPLCGVRKADSPARADLKVCSYGWKDKV
jgi:hypothetical protein